MNKLAHKHSQRVLQGHQDAELEIDGAVDRQLVPGVNPASHAAGMPHPIPAQEDIRHLAYEMYERRGRQSGQDKQDWLRAEKELELVGIRFG